VARSQNIDDAAIGVELLRAEDRLELSVAARHAALKSIEPNLDASSPLDYVISGPDGAQLALRSLAGKVIVMDFWATWCLPCRTQQPLYEQVKSRYRFNPRVVFLNIAADEDHAVVKPFLDTNKWSKTVYFDDGLAHFLHVMSIPTTVVFSPQGDIASRLAGFIPDQFVNMLIERIDEALKQ
jgi:thiol-disulfide isomerase/thioredoxin